MSFVVIPSIDLLAGQVVRLAKGEPGQKTVFSNDPLEVAEDFAAQGAERIHIVDLDGALSGEGLNADAVKQIISSVASGGCEVQVAGGIRSVDAAKRWLDMGAARVVVGTKALTDEAFLAEIVEAIGPELVIAPDAKGGEVRVAGWQQGTGEDVIDAAKRLAAAGVERLLVTDISTDGMLTGPNIELFTDVAEASGLPVIASGGVSSIEDLEELSTVDGLEGAIVGRALYVGAFELSDALKVIS